MADKGEKARDEYDALQNKIRSQWVNFATKTGREAYKDLLEYCDAQRELYRQYAEERQMPGPDGKMYFIDSETAAALLQNSRGVNIVRTYIKSRVDADVAPTNQSK